MTLLAGGASAQLVREVGTAGPVQGFFASGKLHGARLSTALPTTVFFQAGDGAVQVLRTIGNKLWIKVAGVWKEAVTWIKISGVWKQANPKINVAGIWK